MNSVRVAAAGFVALGLALVGAGLWSEEDRSLDSQVADASTAPVPLAASGRASAMPPGLRAATLLARPLFSPDRRPIEPSGPATSATDTLPRLAAVVLAPGLRQAVLVPHGNGRAVRVAEGDRLGGYRICSVRIDSVELETVEQSRAPGRTTLWLQADDAYRTALAEPVAATPAIDPARRESEFENDQ